MRVIRKEVRSCVNLWLLKAKVGPHGLPPALEDNEVADLTPEELEDSPREKSASLNLEELEPPLVHKSGANTLAVPGVGESWQERRRSSWNPARTARIMAHVRLSSQTSTRFIDRKINEIDAGSPFLAVPFSSLKLHGCLPRSSDKLALSREGLEAAGI